ncbi:UDP-N-acetylmuramoyl-L-alanyl-D-glutamate--2,6-diaminopimelate ligase [Vulgatibacter incomptus]|uniref:UDP-N-acetylmuramoyl-L-alanyl-D-glutamate--2,6-diaminopimelate ligase n=1 Tax=Vulgatibacter incomptus TaxID=1391653 RepID=A0A0K1PEA3_9BACT|nr:UDP-N-acetylmuramoyl-L-alanyl-D-glutamate--2,6-diaminopimelate ligase [Vulgatibacter incomptus]AKU91868.1 UDP-N-acetylmuramoylalanyl-D-glutamate--2,6-diaminopimelate ligase [Vulgatibacter incomptus]
MRLSQLIADVGGSLPPGTPDPEIRAVTADSREAGDGALFVCVAGGSRDGHDFAAQAAAKGAAAILVEREVDAPGALVIRVASTRAALARCAAALQGHPEEKLSLVGITGTNGKTTVSWLFRSIAVAAGSSCGVIGTTGAFAGAKELPTTHTTPDSVSLSKLLGTMVAEGCDSAVLEVSSHALEQGRVEGLRFAAAAFTNLTRDHLDYHGSMEAYFEAKARLFSDHLRDGGAAVINADDAWGRQLAESVDPTTLLRFSIDDSACEIFARNVEFSDAGIRADVATPAGGFALRSPLVGAHNLQNLLCATGLALACGHGLEAIAKGLFGAHGAPGRLERVDGEGFSAFVDYAHTDDALARVCAALRQAGKGRLLVVFGCGGDRDKGKRPLMGEVAARAADLAIVTSDNPRSERPEEIIAGILPGLERAGSRRLSHEEARAGALGFAVEPDRRSAIELAVACARPGDFVLVAGKGHETYQLVGDQRLHFDDREELRRALGSRMDR